MRIIIILIALGAFIGLFVNTGHKLFVWFRPLFTGADPLVFGIIYGIIVTAVMVLYVLSRMPQSRIPRLVFLVDHYALGVAVYVMLFVNFTHLVLLLLRLFRLLPAPLTQRAAITAGTAALALAVILSVYGAIHASVIQTKNYKIELQKGDTETESMKIVLISDLHLGYVVSEQHVEKIVEAVNEADPDLVCIAGDIFDGDITAVENPSVLQELIRKINSAYGVYACLGNHDAGPGYEGMVEFLDKADIRLLQDESVLIDNKIILAGRKDSSPIGGQGEKRTAIDESPETEELPRIVLDHNPENIFEYSKSTDLILCGHTHKGHFFPINLVNELVLNFNYGYYRPDKEGPQAIVTSGAGTWGPPLRVGTDSEIAVIQVTFPAAE